MVANLQRGEVNLVLKDQKAVICAEMERLAQLSGVLGTETLQDLYKRLSGAEPLAMYRSLECLLIEGDYKALKASVTSPSDFQIISDAVIESLAAFLEESPKKDEGEAKAV